MNLENIKLLLSLFVVISLFGCKESKTEIATKEVKANPEFAVKEIKGVPFITENGNPIRGRMFYGNFDGSRFKIINAGWNTVFKYCVF